MKSKITYFMERDTRLVVDNLTKVIVNEDIILINYTILRKKIIVVRYIKNENTMIIYDKLKKYNFNIYKAFIEWANEKGIKWYSIGSVIIDEKE